MQDALSISDVTCMFLFFGLYVSAAFLVIMLALYLMQYVAPRTGDPHRTTFGQFMVVVGAACGVGVVAYAMTVHSVYLAAPPDKQPLLVEAFWELLAHPLRYGKEYLSLSLSAGEWVMVTVMGFAITLFMLAWGLVLERFIQRLASREKQEG